LPFGIPPTTALTVELLSTGIAPVRLNSTGPVIAYETVASRFNDLGLTEPVDPGVRPFHDRPFRVLGTERFVRALIGGIGDPALRALPLTGAVDQFVDSTDALAHRARSRALAAALYGVRGP